MKPQKLEKFLSGKNDSIGSKPIILNVAREQDQAVLLKLIEEKKVSFVGDDYEEQLKEYFQIQNPNLVYTSEFEQLFGAYKTALQKRLPLWKQGRWVYFPWLCTIAHILEEEAFYIVRTARNRNLINRSEQNSFYNATIGIVGLSVGNSVALAIALQGGVKHMRIADHDQLALSNLNRIRSGVESLGLKKTEITARQIYLLNPYAIIETFPNGLTKKDIPKFFGKSKKLDLVIDEVDNLGIKLLIREEARRHKIPVVMGADSGDATVVDVERYDRATPIAFFHGRIGNCTYEELTALDKFGIGKTITMHIGPENIPLRMQESLLEMGKTIVSWPQLGGAALLTGCAVAYCVRKILNGQEVEGNRAVLSLDEKLIPSYTTPVAKAKRLQDAKRFAKIFGL